MKKIILASRSPRREALLRQAGLDFSIAVSDADEDMPPDVPPEEYTKLVSRRKAACVAEKTDGPAIIIGADTIVVRDGQIMGKPTDKAHAYEMLKSLQGAKHFVYTGVTVMDINSSVDFTERLLTERLLAEKLLTEKSFVEKTSVFMRPLTDSEILAYIKTGEPMDKAGAYAIQDKGSLLVEKIEGDFYNVVGLPVMKTYLLLKELGAVPFDL